MIWQSPPPSFALKTGEIHLWRSPLASTPVLDPTFWPSLSEDEQIRANRFHFKQHRLEYVDGRGKLRHLLSQYLGMPAQKIVFEYGKQDKPFLPHSKLKFNISHSHGLALFAFALDMEIGVDLEKIDPKIDIIQLCQQFFSPQETQTILQLSPAEQIHAFFTCWTRKEAFIKAKGQGLSLPLDQFAVSILPEAPVQLLATEWDQTEVDKWFLYDIPPGKNFKGALMTDQKVDSLQYWDY